jgi:hypothetical protein
MLAERFTMVISNVYTSTGNFLSDVTDDFVREEADKDGFRCMCRSRDTTVLGYALLRNLTVGAGKKRLAKAMDASFERSDHVRSQAACDTVHSVHSQ